MATVVETNETAGKKRGAKPKLNYFQEKGIDPSTKLEGVPGDYVHGKYEKLTKSNFDQELQYLEYLLAHHNWRKSKIDSDIDDVNKEIEALQRFDSEEKRELYTKTIRAQKRLANLLKELEGEDIDTSEILENLGEDLA